MSSTREVIAGCSLLWWESTEDPGLVDPAADEDLPAGVDASAEGEVAEGVSAEMGPEGGHLLDLDLDEVDVDDVEGDDEDDEEKLCAIASRRFCDELRDVMQAVESPA